MLGGLDWVRDLMGWGGLYLSFVCVFTCLGDGYAGGVLAVWRVLCDSILLERFSSYLF